MIGPHDFPPFVTSVSALFGAMIGGGASLIGAIYTQRTQDRLQRAAGEIAKREAVYADFAMSASNLLLKAYTRDEIALGGDEQRLIGLINRMRLFASPEVVGGAEARRRQRPAETLRCRSPAVASSRSNKRSFALDAFSETPRGKPQWDEHLAPA